MKITKKEKGILELALIQLEKYYDEREETCRKFKWICHDYLPQAGEEYVKNKNVFEIQDKTIKDIQRDKKESRILITKILDSN
jgi:hypothetical protein